MKRSLMISISRRWLRRRKRRVKATFWRRRRRFVQSFNLCPKHMLLILCVCFTYLNLKYFNHLITPQKMQEKIELPEAKKEDQKAVDAAFIKSVEPVPDLKSYLAARYYHKHGHILEDCPICPSHPKGDSTKCKSSSKPGSSTIATAVASSSESSSPFLIIRDLEALLKQVILPPLPYLSLQ
ncbi:60S ribosomal protein L6E, partial [Dillenia turbinata]